MPDMRMLSSKITTPRTSETILRERLLASIKPPKGKKLTMVAAGAGYGKTTLAAQALSHWAGKAIWYRLDASDRDLATFMSYLVAGMRKHHPEFGVEVLDYLSKVHNPASESGPVPAMFLSELEEVCREELIIVLDDYHTVHESREIKEFMEALLRDLSPSVHLVLTSRSEPALPLSRLRAMREVTDIGEDDLAFNADEVARLYSQMFDFSLDRAAIQAICHKMGGWISGLILVCHSLRGKYASEIGPSLMSLRGSRRAIFNYLEENVYGSISPEHQELLIKTSIFPRFTPAFCDELLHMDNSADALKHLEDNHLFTSSIDREGRWYFYHQLFRDFLLTRLKEKLDPEAIVKLHRDAALLLESSDEEDEAAGHYIRAGEFERACRLLEGAGRRLFREGRFQLLQSYLERVPAEFLDAHPWIRFYQAQLEGLCGNPEAAVRKYDKALDRFVGRMDGEGVRNCLVESGLIDFQMGELSKARNRFEEILHQPDLDPKLQVEVLGYMIYILSHFGQMEEADRCFKEAVSLTNTLKDEPLRYRCLIWLYYYRGFHFAFAGEYSKVLEAAETLKAVSGGTEPHGTPIGYYLLVSMACYHLQMHSRGFECAREALILLKEGRPQGVSRGASISAWPSPRVSPRGERGFPDVTGCWLLAYAALNGIESGNAAGALEDAEESLRCFRRMRCRYGEAFAYCVLHEVHYKSGNRAAAERCARSGVEAVRGMTTPSYEALLRLRLARSVAEKGEFEEALQLLNDSDGRVREFMHPFGLNLLLARIHWSLNRHADGLIHLLSALEISRKRRLDSLLISESHWIVPLLVEAFSQGEMQAYISELIGRMAPEARGRLKLLQQSDRLGMRRAASHLFVKLHNTSTPSLQIHLLGKFRVVNDAGEIPGSAWKSRKAKTIFQYLSHERRRGFVNKEILMELLWPEEDPALTAKRFHVALASLRKTLQPGLERGVPSAFISRNGDAYGLDAGPQGWVDVERFKEELGLAGEEKDPERSIVHLLNAESFYGGELMQEEPYSEWLLEPRDRCRMDYLQLLKRIAAYHEHRRDRARAIEYCTKYLEVDPYAEDVCRMLMSLYGEIGDKSGVARVFKRCRENIARELDCGLSDETERLHRKLMAS